MQASETQPTPAGDIAAMHSWLAELAHMAPADTQAVLILGAAVVLHGSLEPCHLGRVLRLADPAVVAEMQADHARLQKDLQFLQEQSSNGADAAETQALAAGLMEALRRHLDRDQRTLYRPLSRLLELPTSGSRGAA